MKLNGTVLKDDKIQVPQYVAAAAEKRKNDERDSCFKQYTNPQNEENRIALAVLLLRRHGDRCQIAAVESAVASAESHQS